MAFYHKSVQAVIQERYNDFTTAEKTIGDFFLKNQKDGDFSVKTIADSLYVSEASVSRFAKKCGYKGYREFVFQYRESLNGEDRDISVSTKTVIESYQDLLTKTCNLMNEAQIARIVQYFNDYKRIIVCGRGSSGLAATEMESRFMRIGVDIDSLTDADRMKMQAIFLNPDCLMIGFSVSGQTDAVLYALQEAHRRGAKTVLVTTTDRIFFRDFCDEVVISAYSQYLETGNTISPQLPLLLIIDVIYNEYMSQNRKEREALHDDSLRALNNGKKPSVI